MNFKDNQVVESETIYGAMSGVVLQTTTRFDGKYDYDIKISQMNNTRGQLEYVLDGGYAVDTFLYLQSLLNFSYVLRPDINPAKFDKDSVEKASIDLYLASYSLLPDRAKYLEPTFVIGQSRILAFMDHAFEVGTANQNIFIIPFTTRLWVCVVVMWIIFIATFLIFRCFEEDPTMKRGDMAFHCISTTLQKGSDNPRFRNSTRIASAILSFAVVIIMASYSGIMTSIFAVNRYTINSIQSLVHSNYKIMLEYGFSNNDSTIKYMLEHLTQIRSVVELLRKAEKSNFVFVSFNDAIREVKRSPSSYIIDEETALNSISALFGGFPCNWEKLPVFNLRYPWVMYMRKNATFQRAFNSGIVRVRERGILNRIRKKWISQPTSSCFSGGGGLPFKSITFSQVKSAFLVLLIIILVICPTLFVVEKTFALVCTYLETRTREG